MGRLDVEPAIKQDDVASYRDQSESWTVLMRQLALPHYTLPAAGANA